MLPGKNGLSPSSHTHYTAGVTLHAVPSCLHVRHLTPQTFLCHLSRDILPRQVGPKDLSSRSYTPTLYIRFADLNTLGTYAKLSRLRYTARLTLEQPLAVSDPGE
jgi:hypothetical protein